MRLVSTVLRHVVNPAAILSAAILLPGMGALLTARESIAADETPASHDIYNPARTALVNARRQLAVTFVQEQDIMEQRQRIHRELDESLKLLADAQKLDPTMRRPIEELSTRIATLESDPCATQLHGKTLKELYDELLTDFEALIEHY